MQVFFYLQSHHFEYLYVYLSHKMLSYRPLSLNIMAS